MNKRGLIAENIPNILTITRVLLTFVVMYMIFTGDNVILVICVFAIAALTDWFDGRLARRFHWESEFGRKADMIADRFLWVGTAIAIIIFFGIKDELNWTQGVQILMIMTREVISAPFAVVAAISGNMLPQARYIAKVTTFIQGFALPALILGVTFPIFNYISWPLSIVCMVTGFWSALYYMKDIQAPTKSSLREKNGPRDGRRKNERSRGRKNKDRKS